MMLLLAGTSHSLVFPHKCMCEEWGGWLPPYLSHGPCIRMGFSVCAEKILRDVRVQEWQIRWHVKRA